MLAEDGPVVKTLRDKFPHAMAVYAFGSQVHGTADAQSDLDLGILVAGYADALALWDTASDLSGVVGWTVDLLDLRAASTVMQYQVITKGTRLWSIGTQVGLFECFVLSEQTALDTAREPLMREIAERGSIHG